MRLILKVTIYYLIIILVVFGAGGIMTYGIFQREVQRETDRYLMSRLRELRDAVENGESLSAFTSTNLSVEEVDSRAEEIKFSFSDTLADHPSPRIDRLEPHRKLRTIQKLNNKTYKIEIFDVIVESDDIFAGVFKSQTRLFIILGAVLVISSFLVSAWLLRPFNRTLEAIKDFKLNDPETVALGNASTWEFKELNSILDKMIRKSRSDYKNLKEFSENASHEMQTPLAVAKGKIELLLQSKGLDNEQLQLINSTYDAINHLSKMSRSLSLMTKIENYEFNDFQNIDLTEKISTLMYDFQELAELKEIRIGHDLSKHVTVESDPTLLQILVSNLFQNAVQHNILKGEIFVKLTKEYLEISNTGRPLSVSTDKLFKRFKKDNQSGETIGLGLAIAKKICELSQFEISYRYQNHQHILTVRFNTQA